jgi:hypothetical protein
MEPKKVHRENIEWQIQQRIIKELRFKSWFVEATFGSAEQSGFPDLFCCHTRYGHRWVEVKKPTGYKFTGAQLEKFPQFVAHGSGIWIATSEIGIEDLLMKPCNWYQYLNVFKGG